MPTQTPYTAALDDIAFALVHHARLDERIATLPGWEEATLETAQAILDECARLAQDVIAPLNHAGDVAPTARREDGSVAAAAGFGAAWQQWAAGGWQGLQHPQAFGGQELPKTIASACAELVHSANVSWALAPMLTDGAIEALLTAASDELQALYLPPLIAGRWTGTMNLTEPNAGSDLAQIRTRAERASDGSWRIFGTKIFITWGEHDMADNIVHLVLARAADAPAGVRGISLFVVPKFIPQADGTLGTRNAVACVGLEHKLGIRASATAVLEFGDAASGTGATGWLVGEENRGLDAMFVMMNAARFAVGIQGVALAERAMQQAAAFARQRIQSRPVDGSSQSPAPIVAHPDVRRMLMTMRALTQGSRALATVAAAAADLSHRHSDAAERQRQRLRYEWLVPVVKGFCTEMAQEVTTLAVQVHGGMGFIEETGVAQHLRDARVLTIYEGTTAIQANDLLGRKTLRDAGEQAHLIAADIHATITALQTARTAADAPTTAHNHAIAAMEAALQQSLADFQRSADWLIAHGKTQPNAAWAGAVPFLMLAGTLLAGHELARAILAVVYASAPSAQTAAVTFSPSFLNAKVATAHFYATHILPRTASYAQAITAGAAPVMALSDEDF